MKSIYINLSKHVNIYWPKIISQGRLKHANTVSLHNTHVGT